MSEKKESLTELQKKEILRMNNKESNQLTRECLQLALIHLMAEQPYEKITVSEIVRRAGVSRTAFYRNYTDKEDILHEMGGKLIEMISELTDKPELFEDSRSWFENVFRLMRENREVLTLLDKAGIQQEYLFSGKSIVETLFRQKIPRINTLSWQQKLLFTRSSLHGSETVCRRKKAIWRISASRSLIIY